MLLERLNDEAVELGTNPQLTVRSQAMAGPAKIVRRIDWKALQNKENRYILRMYPTSSLPQTPAGRLATVQEWIGAGLLEPEEGIDLLGFPDIQATQRLKTADRNKVLHDVSKLLNGKRATAEPFQNLDKSIELTRRALLVAEMDNAPAAGIDAVQAYLEDLQGMREAAIAEEQAKMTAAAQSQGLPDQEGAVAALEEQAAQMPEGEAPAQQPAGDLQ